jgi:hypothetical protein
VLGYIGRGRQRPTEDTLQGKKVHGGKHFMATKKKAAKKKKKH